MSDRPRSPVNPDRQRQTWIFLTNVRQPSLPTHTRDVATTVGVTGVTERAVEMIVADFEDGGYLAAPGSAAATALHPHPNQGAEINTRRGRWQTGLSRGAGSLEGDRAAGRSVRFRCDRRG